MSHQPERAAVPGYYANKVDLQARLKRIEGQVRGVERLIDEDRYCIDILTQISAINAGLRKVAVKLLEDHIGHCIAETIAAGGDPRDKVLEASAAIDRILKA
ncbi:MAG TPA: metal-sensitive transcriptional regulator [Actinomycetota bacterium]|nr:metal-sensitive transcriptional regulator [Actinomycetota bacterium]